MFKRQFIPDKNLLNPKFDGYKLSPTNEKECVTRTSLPNGSDLRMNKFMANHRLGFRDLQARVRLNHLAYGFPTSTNKQQQGVAFYVDLEFQLMSVIYNKETNETHLQPIVQLIQPLGNLPNYSEPSATLPSDPYSPSLISLNSELLLASNGAGYIELVHIRSGTVIASTRYDGDGSEGISPVPCVLLDAQLVGNKIVMMAYSRVASKNTQFNISTLEMSADSNNNNTNDLITTLNIQRGLEVPTYCAIIENGERFILGSESPYEKFTSASTCDDNDAIITDASTPGATTITKTPKSSYSWTQDNTDITVQFILSPNTPKSAISCQFNNTHLSLIVRDDQNEISYPFRKLWSLVKADDCTWTLESDGTLTLFLNKQDQHTRWPHIFDIDDGVMETLDPAKLAEITERLEKFTGNDANNNPTVQNPVATDMDEDIDDKGEPIRFAIYDRLGQCIEEIYSGGCEWLCKAFDCEKEQEQRQGEQIPSICVKVDVDGQIYKFLKEEQGERNNLQTKHINTFDAFGFVQASKRDSRFIYYDPKFKFIVIIESSRNAYIYYHHDDKRSIETQKLVDLTRGEDVNVVGCQLLLDNVLVVLTETQVITIQI
ncbi:hypothetical protein INT45_003574 [Circinella minor]|uniref:NudC domain-containing protein 1 n=1 Tax=Circinella minor TaxID=1195481 RepID=A0A8H7S386_9FUNG|nr:hypothetical protein INT45_003574 [Circinella minor]